MVYTPGPWKLTKYRITNRVTKQSEETEADSAQEACVNCGWLIGDCYVLRLENSAERDQALPREHSRGRNKLFKTCTNLGEGGDLNPPHSGGSEMSEHTRGPWHVSKYGEHRRITDEAGGWIAIVYSMALEETPENGRTEANARLIAAAPEIEAALRAAEWGAWYEGAGEYCPVCQCSRDGGHADNCKLAAVLAWLEE